MSDSSDEDVDLYENDSFDDDGDDDGEEEVLASSDDDDDDDDDENGEEVEGLQAKTDKFSRFKIERKKDDMASDIEEDDEDDGLPSSQAWGANKQIFYDTDFVDKDYRSQKAKEEDLAKYEEEEALAIQKRLLTSVNEKDLGLDFLFDAKPTQTKATESSTGENEEEKQKDRLRREKVGLNLSALNRGQKLAIIRKETPELEPLLADMRRYLAELKDDLEPALHRLKSCPRAQSTPGLRYLQLRFRLLLNYCTNISFYFSLVASPAERSKDHLLRDHPVIRELFRHKKLIAELDAVRKEKGGKSFEAELELLAKSIAQKGEKLVFVSKEPAKETANDEEQIETAGVSKTTKKSSASLDDDDDLDEDDFEGDEGEEEEEEGDGKRAITYAMEKNKGLIPKRKREQRNPRVKYRKKFDRATQRRKGQVREPRKEVKKYGGELTGINARTVKSVKFH
ncbi:PREDICTED: something about silencing protein 10-like [Rhagoletis zephyria]|uniref:something about silencing protein 10-like n=1 Tax=Rhagoletis zephyria TaxID=28612 RepID=UPI0008112333|nr:PREDICTED: something about silencing protein 10-like [Rhagoletis zephyria]KAH9392611.1 Something about silencing protein 10 [Tyrophagus putrescentiae]